MVVGFGGATYDLHIKSDRPVILKDSNPATTNSSPGGVMRNILSNLQMLGTNTSFISSVGNDIYGKAILDSCTDIGMDVSGVEISDEHRTALYIDFLGSDGDMVVAANAMKIIDDIGQELVRKNENLIKGASAVVIDANLTNEAMSEFLKLAEQENIPVFCDTVSVNKAGRVKPVLDKITVIKPNLMELSELSDMKVSTKEDIEKAAKILIDKGIKKVVVTLGSEGAYYRDNDDLAFFMKLSPVEIMANATGAGDAFTAGLIHGYEKGMNAKDMVEFALGCGKLAVQSELTINPEMSEQMVYQEIGKR